MLKINQVIKLTGKTEQDKVNLTIHGERYKILGIQLGMAFDNIDGPWYLIRSTNTGILKWVHETQDKHYDLVGTVL